MRIFYFILFWCIPLAAIGGGIAAIEKFLEWGQNDFWVGQTLTIDQLEFSMIVLDRNGEEVYRNFENENREWTPLEEIPELLKKASIQVEDKRFYEHHGVDFKGISRAMFQNAMAGGIVQGGSTLTQQLARKVFLSNEQTYIRKIREMFMALGIESRFNKDEILEMYLNSVPYGARVNGVAVAAEHYFDKTPDQLSEAEILVLSVMPKDPVRLARTPQVIDWMGSCRLPVVTDCDPFRDLSYKFSRLESLLFAMADVEGWDIDKTRNIWEEIKQIKLPQREAWVDDNFQHFRFYIEKYLAENGFDHNDGSTNGLIIRTSLDSELQREIFAHMRAGPSLELATEHWISNYAISIIDHESRGPLVWIGSKNFWNPDIDGQVDVLQARRQTGSAIKPFIYAGAIEKGYQPPTIFYDAATSFRQDGSSVRNADGGFSGGMRMSAALARSRNVPAAKALILAGGERTVKKYLDSNFGFDIDEVYRRHFFGWTLALGTAPVKMIDLANAYATLGSSEQREICPILDITDFAGQSVPNPCNAHVSRRLKTSTTFFINNILSNRQARPKDWDTALAPNKNMAIKTGTSSKRVGGEIFPVDDIVVGYTPKATVLLWTGNTDGKGLKPGSVAVYSVGETWRDIANIFLEKHPEKWGTWQRPADLVKVNGEWATANYVHPGYDALTPYVMRNLELGLNPLYTLDHER